MKPIITAAGIVAVFILCSATAAGTSFVWDGGSTTSWHDQISWVQDANYPGEFQTGDTATIDANTPYKTVVVSRGVPYAVDSVLVDAETAGVNDVVDGSVDLALKVDSSDPNDPDLAVDDGNGTGYIQLIAGSHTFTVEENTTTWPDDAMLWVATGTLDVNGAVIAQAAESAAADAEIQITGGTFTPDAIVFDGSQTQANGHAIGDFDVSVTVQSACGSAVDTWMEGHVDIQLANSSTVSAKDLQVGDYNSSGNSGTVTLSGAGTLSACSVVIKGDSVSGNSTVTASNGAMLQTY